MENISKENIIENLILLIPETKEMIDNHIKENEEILVTLLLDELADDYRVKLQAKEAFEEYLGRLNHFIKLLIQEGDNQVRNIVNSSFLENIACNMSNILALDQVIIKEITNIARDFN